MTEYEQLCCILNDRFLSDSQDVMIENKGDILKPQSINIEDGNRKRLARRLYRFDLEEEDFLPFFNNKKGNIPDGLRKFCDYILLANYNNKTYILLIELKRGDTYGEADKQLRASEYFIEFICQTASRLHKDFNDFDFNHKNVVLRKIKIRACKSNKNNLKPYHLVDKKQDIIPFICSDIFPLVRFL